MMMIAITTATSASSSTSRACKQVRMADPFLILVNDGLHHGEFVIGLLCRHFVVGDPVRVNLLPHRQFALGAGQFFNVGYHFSLAVPRAKQGPHSRPPFDNNPSGSRCRTWPNGVRRFLPPPSRT